MRFTVGRLSLFLTAAPIALALAVPVMAAEMDPNAPVFKAPVAPAYAWTGWYVGVNAGYAVGSAGGSYAASQPPGFANLETFNAMPASGFLGGQVGYGYRIGRFVIGAETDLQGSVFADNRTCMFGCFGGNAAIIDDKLTWFGTTRARIGLTNGPVLTYVTAGAAYGGAQTGVASSYSTAPNGTSPPFSTTSVMNSGVKAGWTLGAGVEAALVGNWTVKLEYLYLNLGDASVSSTIPGVFSAAFNTKQEDQILRVGANYRFGPDPFVGTGTSGFGAYGFGTAAGFGTPGIGTPGIGTYKWAGLFVGGTLGFGIGRNDSTFNLVGPFGGSAETFYLSPRGFNSGAIAGHNWQFGPWIAGFETDFQGSTGTGYVTCVAVCDQNAATSIDQKLSSFGTVRGRFGYTVGPALFYGTGGAAYGQIKDTIAQTGFFTDSQSYTHGKSGYAVGGGIEYKLDLFGLPGSNWTARTEYLYVDLGRVTDSFTSGFGYGPQTLTSNLHEHVWRTVLSYSFGDAMKLPLPLPIP